jgi:hypothetical protein
VHRSLVGQPDVQRDDADEHVMISGGRPLAEHVTGELAHHLRTPVASVSGLPVFRWAMPIVWPRQSTSAGIPVSPAPLHDK